MTQRGGQERGLAGLLARDTLLYGIGHVVARSTYLILVPVLTRSLSTAELGTVDLLTVSSVVALSVVSLEVNQALARFAPPAAPDERKRLASSALWFALLAFGAFTAAVLLLADGIGAATLGSPDESHVVRAAGIYAGTTGIFLITQGLLRWELRAGAYALTAAVMALISLGSVVVLVVGFQTGPAGVFLGNGLGAVAATGLAFWLGRESVGRSVSLSAMRQLLRFSAPLVPATAGALVALYADRFIISRSLGNAEVGVYSVGYRVASIVGLSVAALQLALTPLIYARYERKTTPAELASVLRGLSAVAALLWLTVTLFAADIVGLLATVNYIQGSKVVPFLAGSTLVASMVAFAPGLWIAGRTVTVAAISLGTATLAVSLNLILVPPMGITGAAFASLIASAAGFTVTYIAGQRHYAIPHHWPTIIGFVGTAIAAAILIGAANLAGTAGYVTRVAVILALTLGYYVAWRRGTPMAVVERQIER